MQPLCDDFFRDLVAPSGPSSAHLNPFVRAYLDAVRAYIHELHDKSLAARQVNEEHADLIDRLIRKLFRLAEDRFFMDFPRLNFRLALLAVGGYGRRELSLGSDIDLLFVYRGKMNPYVETITEAITTRLWDARMTVGSATRTIRDCLRVGQTDLPTLTSYLDSRFLIGDPGLYAELDAEVQRHIRGSSSDFIQAKIEERDERHARMGESLFLLQPNLRESVGGLRDYQTALWIARAVRWEVRRPEHLLLHGFIDSAELDDLVKALDFQWRIRNQLHRGGRKEDRLHYEAQIALAEHLGFADGSEKLAVEQLMEAYYLHARALDRVSRRAIDHAESLERKRRGRRQPASRPIEEGFAIADGRLEIPSPSLLEERPVRLLAAFAACQEHDVDISPRALRLIRQHLDRVDDSFREDPEAAQLFKQILAAPRRVYRVLITMDEVGLLGAYLPEFAKLVSLWQHDMYHTYTVDVHSLFLVEQLRRLLRGRFADELPLATQLMQEVRNPVALYLGCILHDVGKGQGGGHSEKGARQIPAIAKRLGVSEEDTDTIRFLVLHHLTMSAMAEQRDVHDPRQILKLANLVETRTRLRNLYLVTVADIRSVSPEAWTTWKAGLLEALYRNAAEWLEAGAGDEAAPGYFLQRSMQKAEETQGQALELLKSRNLSEDQIVGFLDSMPRRYLLNHGPTEVAAHLAAAFEFLESGRVCGIYPFPAQAGQEVFWGVMVLAHDRPGLLSLVAGVLASCGHNVLASQAYTNRNGLAVEIYQLRPLGGGDAEEEHELERLQARLEDVLEGRQTVENLLQSNRSRAAPKLRVRPPTVRITNEESDFYTIIDVIADDRIGLLHDITRTLATCDLDVVMARASTRASRVSDAFYVTSNELKLLEGEPQKKIEEELLRSIRQGSA